MGNIHGVLDQIAAYPFDALAIEEGRKDYDLDVGEIRRRLGDERVLFGNVSCMQVVEGRPEEILAEVRRQIAVAGRSGRFVVSIGEPLPQGTPAERVRFFCDSTRLISGS
jgi:uroporphyrinogen-III decarboxylase